VLNATELYIQNGDNSKFYVMYILQFICEYICGYIDICLGGLGENGI
jgi:hypothetical protein